MPNLSESAGKDVNKTLCISVKEEIINQIKVKVSSPKIEDIQNYDYRLKKQDDDYPGVYVFYNKNQRKIYVGESNKPYERLKSHLQNKRLHEKEIKVFKSKLFNKSVVYDIESQLLGFINGEQLFKLENKRTFQKQHNYFLKKEFKFVTEKIWQYFLDEKIFKKSILKIKESVPYQLSPFKVLNDNQSEVTQKILNWTKERINNEIERPTAVIISGYPGTGKSLLAAALTQNFCQEKFNVYLTAGTKNVVNAFKKTFRLIQNLKNLKILKMSDICKNQFLENKNKLKKRTVLIVDEAHRLIQKIVKGHPSKYKHITNDKNELQIICEKYDFVIFFYDENQIVHPSDINNDIEKTFRDYHKRKVRVYKYKLEEQMRCQDAYEYIKKLLKFFKNKLDFDNKKNFYDVKLFDSFSKMYSALWQKQKKYSLTRLLAGETRKWLSKNNKNEYDFNDLTKGKTPGLRWNNKNAVQKDWINSVPAKKLKEVAYYHTIQGMDLQYAGVIIGKDLSYKNGKLQVNEEYVVQSNQKPLKSDENYKRNLRQMIINRYKILLTRGAKGTYIFAEDEGLRKVLKKVFKSETN